MDDELTPEQKFAAEDPEAMVPHALLQGRSTEDIVAELIRHDWSPAAAGALVARVAGDLHRFQESDESRQRLIAEARRQFFGGLLLTLVGVPLSMVTCLASLAGGIPGIIAAFGLQIIGLIVMRRGWARWRLYRGWVRQLERLDESADG